jgi:putative toxin-antitoxin system antitoxin component (TIGR02293 family)
LVKFCTIGGVRKGRVKGGSARAYVLKGQSGAVLVTGDRMADKWTIILVGATGKPENQLTSFEKMELSEEGITKKDLERLKEHAGLDYDKLAQALAVTRTTLINKKGKAKFNFSVSEKILALADIYSYGYEVFGDREKFNRWILRENTALGGKRPFDLLHSSFGREEVKHLIGRIDYGVYS